jgi:hypothetical protein
VNLLSLALDDCVTASQKGAVGMKELPAMPPYGTPITDRIIEASIQCAERIMQRIDTLNSK